MERLSKLLENKKGNYLGEAEYCVPMQFAICAIFTDCHKPIVLFVATYIYKSENKNFIL